MTQLQSLRGMVDLMPAQTHRWQAVEAIARAHFGRSGFKEIRTPILEVTELFARGIGEATDVVGKEMYSFQDRGDRSCTLRPEGTASVVRAAVQHGLLSQGAQKLWYGGPMFRYERPQAGRQRQFHQIGVEWLGVSSARSDAEVIVLAWDLLASLGLCGLDLQINSLGTPEDRQSYRDQLVAWLEARSDHLDADSQQRLTTNPLRILDSKNSQTQELLSDAPTLLDALCADSAQRFEAVQSFLVAMGIPFSINERLVRGLDYYGHTAFEITSNQLGAQATVCGGGRYDGLVQQLGGPVTSAIGWALGMERLLLVLEAAASADPDGVASRLTTSNVPDFYLVNRGEKAEASALVLARKLRDAGFSVEIDDSGAAFGKQFKRADRSGAAWAVVIGDQEAEVSQFLIKPLHAEGDEHRLALEDFQDVVGILQG
ncbi:histidine--tRNA ligase [Synechococcus sp. BIOS-U3-1]|uniref:histidine--tRNA ligase n=1 Tax=Synechococcus sp. BIOS-U3-1 TaxID=1400865 RepID=UPI0016451032|nr:histidine--tRNA ligase [Synechococcus sp. BIOS-U3-1]QNI57145.1 histidine--tRNA ligase [Synechococcus sp. BIOS-U3-1]